MGDILVAIFADTWPGEHLGADIQQNLVPGQSCTFLEGSLGPNACRDPIWAAATAKSLQSCLTLCDPIGGSPQGSPIPGILQAQTLEWVAISFSNAWKVKSESEVTQSCLTLLDPMDCSLPGSSVHRIFQARVLEWVAIAFSAMWARHDYTWFWA